ncbi:MAG: GNAT family N-acetyltransferase [Alphaproteobacteria bacterium]|nr:GNAT family N-acetyltransferase [Alphaproteobacteria bacterium]
MASGVSIIEAGSAADIAAVKTLFLEYAGSLGFDLCFQGFDAEMATFPAMYARPKGVLLLARVDGAAAGAVGMRPYGEDGTECEMKRLYVRPAFRGVRLGRHLAEAVIAEAATAGYRRMRLDTLESMPEASALYEALGFTHTEPYYQNPIPGARYYLRALFASVKTAAP